MKTKISQQVRVGTFVLVGLLLSMAVIFLLGNGLNVFERQFHLYARFKDISGLRLDAPVFLAGIQVGKVEDIVFPKELSQQEVIVKLQIQKKYQDRMREDSMVSITTQGLLGDKAIFITMGSPEYAQLKDGEDLQVKQALSLEAFSERGQELIDNVNKLATNVSGLVDDVKTKEGLVHALIYDPDGKKLVKDLNQVTASAQSLMRQIQGGNGMLHALIYDPVHKDIGQAFSQTADNLKAASHNFNSMSAKMERGEGSIGGLVNDPTVYYDLMTLLGKANRNKLLRTVIRATLATNEKDLTEK